MSLQSDDITKLCDLARLAVSEDELDDVKRKLSQIVDFVASLQAVDTQEVVPLAHPLDRPQRLREDLVTEPDEHELFQRNAGRVERGLYLVPKVLE